MYGIYSTPTVHEGHQLYSFNTVLTGDTLRDHISGVEKMAGVVCYTSLRKQSLLVFSILALNIHAICTTSRIQEQSTSNNCLALEVTVSIRWISFQISVLQNF
jgi:hypothetical protein